MCQKYEFARGMFNSSDVFDIIQRNFNGIFLAKPQDFESPVRNRTNIKYINISSHLCISLWTIALSVLCCTYV